MPVHRSGLVSRFFRQVHMSMSPTSHIRCRQTPRLWYKNLGARSAASPLTCIRLQFIATGGVVTTQKASISVYSSGSSVQIASSVSSRAGETIARTGQTSASSQGRGTSTVMVNRVSLEATYCPEGDNLSVVVQGFDHDDPGSTRLHE